MRKFWSPRATFSISYCLHEGGRAFSFTSSAIRTDCLWEYLYNSSQFHFWGHTCCLPKGEENDCFDGEELPHRIDGFEEVLGSLVEVEERVEGNAD